MLRRSDTGEDLLDRVANEMPDAQRVQLLRSVIDPSLEHGRDTHQRRTRYAWTSWRAAKTPAIKEQETWRNKVWQTYV